MVGERYVPTKKELEEALIKRHSLSVQEKIAKGRVAIAGLGGLGSNIAMMLARLGVGELFLVDFDQVDLSNLNRQCYGVRHLGVKKTEALQAQIKEVNPYVQIKTKTIRVTEENAVELFLEYPIVCEAFDQAENKAMLVNTILQHCPNIKIVSGSGMGGYGSSNEIGTKKVMNNFYICGDLVSGIEKNYGLMAPRVQLCASHQANMILRLLLGIEEE
ncbi:sulfur carrier protein ThiS adenylyltransferase ThiF [Anaerotignum sp. MB30-C6]|nr:sulfur carrier protein ThiS adenylyltransferase ThiF [Anaerotignum sp. MB30-C6]WMI80574.1 sulfur carrier protein ThiS adenylyltransferase ThiF [Anaerotignum sp. MB30-C6]